MSWKDLFNNLSRRDGSWNRIGEVMGPNVERGRQDEIVIMERIQTRVERVCKDFAERVGAETSISSEDLKWVMQPTSKGLMLIAPVIMLRISHPLFPIGVYIFPKIIQVQHHVPWDKNQQCVFVIPIEHFDEEWLAKVLVTCEGRRILVP